MANSHRRFGKRNQVIGVLGCKPLISFNYTCELNGLFTLDLVQIVDFWSYSSPKTGDFIAANIRNNHKLL